MRATTLFLIGVGVIVVPFFLLLFLASGPAGWLLMGLAFVISGFVKLYVDDSEDGGKPNGNNCPECGARNDAAASACHYCDAAM